MIDNVVRANVSIRVRSRERTIRGIVVSTPKESVSIRVRSRERTITVKAIYDGCKLFQSASALASGRLGWNTGRTPMSSFNPRPLSRADDKKIPRLVRAIPSFNPRPLSRADDQHMQCHLLPDNRFNPRPLSRADDA